MKSLSKIFARYLMTALLVIAVTLFLNLFLYIVMGFQMIRSLNRQAYQIKDVAEELMKTEEEIILSDNGYVYLKQDWTWAMLLDDEGEVIWNWQLPEHLNHAYTASEIAVFSKWYLDDYPVTERVTNYGLLVAAQPKDSVWKYNISDSTDRINYIVYMIPVTFGFNLFFVFLLSLFLGFLFYRSLRAIAFGIQKLSEQQPIHLPEKGMTELLARQLNRTSDILTEQKRCLVKRDDARKTWINGVSHDIRTPLSLIMGYASALKEDPALSEEQQQKARLIELQSLQIRQLIEDLNLTSKLEYEMQPLRLTELSPSRLLRTVVSDFYNQDLCGPSSIDLYIDQDVEQMTLDGDSRLLTRAFHNLIQNSIRHNPDGCVVTVTAYPQEGSICFQVSDDGCGIPDKVIQFLEGRLSEEEKAPHVMGLRIAYQVFQAHGWEMIFSSPQTIHIISSDCTERKVPAQAQSRESQKNADQ